MEMLLPVWFRTPYFCYCFKKQNNNNKTDLHLVPTMEYKCGRCEEEDMVHGHMGASHGEKKQCNCK